jgi:hypothetical protein
MPKRIALPLLLFCLTSTIALAQAPRSETVVITRSGPNIVMRFTTNSREFNLTTRQCLSSAYRTYPRTWPSHPLARN